MQPSLRPFGLTLLGAFLLAHTAVAQDAAGEENDDAKVQAVHRGTTVTTSADGLPIVYTRRGPSAAPGVIFIHSILASSLNWERQLNSALADDFALAAVDMRGHGASAKPWEPDYYLTPETWAADIEAVRTASAMEKPVLVAWSYGGLFAMDYIRTYGTGSISGLVLVGSKAGFEEPKQSDETLARRIQVARNTSPNIRVIHDWTAGHMKFLVEDGPDADAERAMFLAASLMTPYYVRPNFRERPTDNRDLASSLDIPLLFIVGGNDVVNKADDVRAIAAQFPAAQVKVYEGTGSMPFWYQDERFNADLRSFIGAAIRRGK